MRRWLLVLVVLAAGCTAPPAVEPSASPTGNAPTGSAAPTDAAAATDAAGVPAALDWTAPLVGGGQLTGGDLAGGDVVLWFWAPW